MQQHRADHGDGFDPTATQAMDLREGYETLSPAPDECPQCGEAVLASKGGVRARFCLYCRLPLFYVADKYQLIRKLGEGGGGVVYLARHIHLRSNAMRVLKFMKTDKGNDDASLKRFVQEMEWTASLSQQNSHITRVYDDFGHVQGMGFFYVMEYLEGLSLNKWISLQKGPIRASVAYQIIFQLCEALRVIHDAGIIHRDLKPENIQLISSQGNPYFVKLMDFGIAKSLERKGLTQTRQGLLGTPFYMTPEQFMGKPVDQRSDIYAVGLIFYELLTGQSPFKQCMDGGNALMQAASAHLFHVPAPIQPQRPHHNVPTQMEALIMRALSKDPAERPPSVVAFLEEMMSLTRRRGAEANPTPAAKPVAPKKKASGPRTALARLRQQRFIAGALTEPTG